MRYSNLLSVISLAIVVSGEQTVFEHSTSTIRTTAKRRPLTGRFLHLTDFHPDPHYLAGASFSSGCHRRSGDRLDSELLGKGKRRATEERGETAESKGKGRAIEERGETANEESWKPKDVAGKWGSGVSDCDAPMSLVNLTFAYLKKEWADKVDFVIWTGDSARHDIDRQVPRTPKEIYELNRMMVSKMEDTFGKDVVIVPSVGNNDVYPHNVFAPGPSSITEEYLRIWKTFIPEDSRHIFERGAYFSVEVIPDTLAVISLNTLYWYDANTLVDGCRDRSSDPGAKEMDWLEVQLSEFRERGMQVWLAGHVPPHMGHYFDNCYLRYGDLALRYQDTIVGHLFGHMNVDHFFFIDVQELEATTNADFLAYHSNLTIPVTAHTIDRSESYSDFVGPALRHGSHLARSGRYRIKGRKGDTDLGDELRKDFREMPGAGKIKLKDYAVMNVAPSVIPTYLPSVRVYTYNITGLNHQLDSELQDDMQRGIDDDLKKKKKKKHRNGGHRHHLPKDDCSRPENEDKPHCVFKNLPRYYSKHSPSRSNQPLTPLGYTQFYLPGVDSDSDDPPEWEIEYTTYKLNELLGGRNESGLAGEGPVPRYLLPGYDEDLFKDGQEWMRLDEVADDGDEENEVDEGVQKGTEHENNDYNLNDNDDNDDNELARRRKTFMRNMRRITPWKMKDLTINSYVKLTRKLVSERKMWDKFSELMFVSSSK